MIYLKQRLVPPFRADLAGRFPMPARLVAARGLFDIREIGNDALTALEDDEIQRFVARLRDMGMDTATDGGWRHDSGLQCFLDGLMLDGHTPHPLLRHFNHLLSVTPMGMTARLSLPAPGIVCALAAARGLDEAEVARRWSELLGALSDLGCRNILLEGYAGEPLNGVPQEISVGVAADTPLTVGRRVTGVYLAPGLMPDAVDGEAVVALGVEPGTKRDELLKRIEDASAYISVERLCLCAQTSFASPDPWDTVRLVGDVASQVW